MMPYIINHVHIRSLNPRDSAAWYYKHFSAKTISDREVLPGTFTISMEIGGPVKLNISSQPTGSSTNTSIAELNQLGLEHFGLEVDDLEKELDRLQESGVRIVLPVTEVSGGTKLAYIEGPDGVLIELVESS